MTSLQGLSGGGRGRYYVAFDLVNKSGQLLIPRQRKTKRFNTNLLDLPESLTFLAINDCGLVLFSA